MVFTYLRPIFQIIFTPFRWLSNFLTKPKETLLEWRLNCGPNLCQIETVSKGKLLSDNLLISAYILFLARYFYICDKRQVELMKGLLNHVSEINSSNKLAFVENIYNAIFKTLNPVEQDAVKKLFLIRYPFWFPPFTYSEDKKPSFVFAKYSFFVFKRNDKLGSIFHMSSGPDIILLPLLVGILYSFVIDKLIDKNKKENLDKAIIDLLEGYNSVNCRLLTTSINLPQEVLKKNNINFEEKNNINIKYADKIENLANLAKEFVKYSTSAERSNDLISNIEEILERRLNKDEEFKLRINIEIFISSIIVYAVSSLDIEGDKKIFFVSQYKEDKIFQILGNWSVDRIENYTTLLNAVTILYSKWFENVRGIPTQKDYENLWDDFANIIITNFNFGLQITSGNEKQYNLLRKIIKLKLASLNHEIMEKFEKNINILKGYESIRK